MNRSISVLSSELVCSRSPRELWIVQQIMIPPSVRRSIESRGNIGKSVIGSNIHIEVNELFTHFESCFWNFHDVSASQLEVLVTWCFPLRELPRKQELVVDREQLVSLFTVHWLGVFLFVYLRRESFKNTIQKWVNNSFTSGEICSCATGELCLLNEEYVDGTQSVPRKARLFSPVLLCCVCLCIVSM